MDKILVVYWSGSGNTEAMANAIVEGINSTGKNAELFNVADNPNIDEYEKIAFGCPAMGAENLEESEFEPYFSEVENNLSGKKVALFGSYSWGSGEWMEQWVERTKATGAILLNEGLIVNETPDDEGLAACEAFGKELADF